MQVLLLQREHLFRHLYIITPLGIPNSNRYHGEDSICPLEGSLIVAVQACWAGKTRRQRH